MAVAATYSIPHSRFLTWDADDRSKAIAHYLRQAETHGPCGTRPAEWDESQGGHRNAYTARKRRCRGCEVREQAESSVDPQLDGRGVHVVLVRNRDSQ